MEYLKGARVLRDDPEWMSKTFLAGLAAFVPVIGRIALIGWSSLILRRAISGQDSPLPRFDLDFDYLGKLLTVGFKGFLASILWSLPIVGLVMVGYCCFYGGVMVMMGGMVAAGEAGGEGGAVAGGIVSLVLGLTFLAVMIVAVMVISMLLIVGVTRAEIADDINVSLRFKETWAMTRMLFKELFIGFIVLYFAALLGSFVGFLTLCLGYPLVIGALAVIGAHYRAELYKVYLQKGGQPLPMGPLAVPGGDAALVQAPGQPAQPQGGAPQPQGQPPQGGGWGPPPSQF